MLNSSELLTARASGPVRGADLERLEVIERGAFAVDKGRIVDVGTTEELAGRYEAERVVDADGHLVTPAFSDPHTHLVHGGSRHTDWEDRVLERPSRGIDSGILSTLRHTAEASDSALNDHALAILDEMLGSGTTAIEAKTGYGLTAESELRLLRLTSGLEHPIAISTTYLGAHTVPAQHADQRDVYVGEVIASLPSVREFTDVCDIAVDPVSFSAAEGERLARAAQEAGFTLRFHADQTADADGTLLATQFDALSVDHLDYVSDQGLEALAESDTVGVIFPSANSHLLDGVPSLRDPDNTPRDLPRWAARLRASGAALAFSTDYNPGTAPCTSMQDVMRLGMRLYRWSVAAVWNLATLNAAHALGAGDRRGSIEVGKDADFVIWTVTRHGEVPYRVGGNLAKSVYVAGELVVERGAVTSQRAHARLGAAR